MSAYVPILTEAVTRAWGLDDPRVLTHLRAENQPGRHQRTKAVGDRAWTVGWPIEASNIHDARIAQTRAARRLERMDVSHNRFRISRPRIGRPQRRPDDAYETDDQLVSIFDE